jgi:hypothetical protein
MIKPVETQERPTTSLNVVMHWTEELERRVRPR